MRVWVAAALVAGLVSGCVGLEQPACRDDGDEMRHGDLRTPWVDGSYLRTDPSATWETVVLQTGHGDHLEPSVFPDGWSVTMESLSGPVEPTRPTPPAPPGAGPLQGIEGGEGTLSPSGHPGSEAAGKWDKTGGGGFSVLRVSPGPGKGRLDLDYSYSRCDGPQAGTITWDLAAPADGDRAEPGKGVHVYTAGFLEDGTLFYTNIKAIDHDDWPRTDEYAWEGNEPLPVYVYEEDRAEEPAYWEDPQAGTPVKGTVPGLGYHTTIPGFNDALKGLSTNTVRVVRLEPEEAYTRDGYEDHPLYGKPLVFYIKAADVVPLPCPMASAWLCGMAPPEKAEPHDA